MTAASARYQEEERRMFRHEYKYTISQADCLLLSRRLSAVMKHDENADEQGNYYVRSLYFDDVYNTAFHEKLSGINHRSKFRIRMYNFDTGYITLEKKQRSDGMSLKHGVRLTLEECESILSGDISWMRESKIPLLFELYRKMTAGMKPRSIIEYQRQAFVCPAGNVRITFDKHICASSDVSSLLRPVRILSGVPLDSFAVLEVKYDAFLPMHIRNIMQDGRLQLQSVSKYVLGRAFEF